VQVALLFDAAKNAAKRKRGETTAALKTSAGLPESHSSKGTRPRQRNSGRSLASIHEQGVGGARRNRTADNGFADHCLTTWRPRHRGKLSVLSHPLSVKEKTIKSPPNLMRSGRGRLGESEAFPVQFCAQHFSCKLFCLAGKSSLGAASCATTTTGLAGCGDRLLL